MAGRAPLGLVLSALLLIVGGSIVCGNVLSHLSGRKLPNSGMRAKGSANEKVPRSRIHEVSDARKDTQTDAQTFNSIASIMCVNPRLPSPIPALQNNAEPYMFRIPEAALAIRAGDSDGLSEFVPLKEIKVLDRDGQLPRDADVISLQGQEDVREVTLTCQASESGNITPGQANSDNGERGETNKASQAKVEGSAPVAEEQHPAHAPSERDNPGKVSEKEKLDEELVRRVLQDALEAKRKPEDPWAKCAKEVWEFEESLVERWKEDINNLLLFSGLFSTVLTGFIVPFYVTLAATQTLISMSGHLSVVAADAGHTTIANWLIMLSADSQSSSGPSSAIVAVAVLWFAALILSLGAASVAISISQWLHHHVNGASKTSRQSVRVWFFRRRGLTRWGVEQAVAVLPLLLQFALVLFLLGLDILLWTISTAVAGVATTLITLLLVPTIVTSVIPSFSPDCPYKSAQAWWFFRFWRWAMRKLENSRYNPFRRQSFFERGCEYMIRRIWNRCCQPEKWRITRDLPALSNWRELDNFCMQTLEDDSETKLQMLVEADSRVMDETFLSTVVRPCLQQANVEEALPAFYKIVDHRAHDHDQDEEHKPMWWRSEQDYQAVSMLGNMSLDMFDKVACSDMASGDRKKQIGHICELVESLLPAIPRTMPAAYSRLMDMWAVGNFSDEECVHIALPLVGYYPKLNDVDADTNTFRKVLTLFPTARRELSTKPFLRYSYFALDRAADLPPSDFAQVREEIQGALAAVAGYFSPSNMESVAQEISLARAWFDIHRVFEACARLAENYASLFTQDVVDTLAGCAARCLHGGYLPFIRSSLEQIQSSFDALHKSR
ncbi:predicted protein [Postia placenta Mad-698-R]|nr:predicted protein [Postia placenta Mad-698-R]